MKRSAVNVADALLGVGRPDDTALIDGSERYTYADLQRATATQATILLERGLPPGSRVGLLAPNSLFWVASYLATMYVGHTVVPFAPTLTADDIIRKAAHVGATTLFADQHLVDRYRGISNHMAHIDIGERMRQAVVSADTAELPAAREPATNAVLVFTSGTTSAPRAVCVSHENIRANTSSIVQFLQLRRNDRVAVILPFSYCYGASLLHTHLAVGASLRICHTQAFPQTIVDAIEQDSCTGVAGVPSSFQQLLRASSFEARPLVTLRLIQQAGGRLPHAQLSRILAAQPHAEVFVMYGQTEATARLAYLPPQRIHDKPGSVGRAIPGVRLRVCDEDGMDLPAGSIGEIRAAGANITGGYWQDQAGTAAKYVDDELRTGDLGRLDEEGFLYIVDRRDDFIKSWGIRVSSHEIEDAVLELGDVSAAAAVGRPDPDAGEAIVLFAVLRPGSNVDGRHLRQFLAGRLARHLVPHEVRILAELPLNQNGKVVKTRLRELARSIAITTSNS